MSGLSCVNYTAEFSWRVYSCLADTQLQLSCHNGTHVRELENSVFNVLAISNDSLCIYCIIEMRMYHMCFPISFNHDTSKHFYVMPEQPWYSAVLSRHTLFVD